MKKFLPYILILVFLAGIFNPNENLLAQPAPLQATPNTNFIPAQPGVTQNATGITTPVAQLGTCYFTPPGDKPTSVGGKTRQDCNDIVKNMGGTSATWKADGAGNGTLE